MIARVLTDEQIDKVHGASLEILERVGVVVPHEELLGRFADAGARVERHSSRVRIAPELVMDSVANSGKRFTIYGRDTSLKASFGEGTRNYNSIAGEAHWVDEPGGARRYATLEDVATASRFADALEQVNIVGAMADPHDLPAQWRSVAVAAAQIRNTTKPVTFWFHDRSSAKFIGEILVALRGDQKRASEFPLCYPLLEPISPLRFPFDGVDLLFERRWASRLPRPWPARWRRRTRRYWPVCASRSWSGRGCRSATEASATRSTCGRRSSSSPAPNRRSSASP
jgi:trimethylamine--corrinoid protein Co-methyltransferase